MHGYTVMMGIYGSYERTNVMVCFSTSLVKAIAESFLELQKKAVLFMLKKNLFLEQKNLKCN